MRFLFVIIGLLVLLTPVPVVAQDGLVQCGVDINGDGRISKYLPDPNDPRKDSTTLDPTAAGEHYCAICDGFQLINNIVNTILFIFVPLTAPIFIVIGGFFIMTAAGNPGRHDQGKMILTATIVGLLVTYTAWAVVNTFLSFIGLVEWTGLTNDWWVIVNCP